MKRIERLRVLKEVNDAIREMKDENLPRIQKLRLLKKANDGLRKLKLAMKTMKAGISTLLDAFNALTEADFAKLSGAEMLAKIKAVVEDIKEIDPVKPKTIKYIGFKLAEV